MNEIHIAVDPISEPWLAEGISRATWYRRTRPVAAAQALPFSEPRWYCVRTMHQGELTADFGIRLAGFPLFAPSLWRPGQPARRSNGIMRAATRDRIEPLFRRYLFVQLHLTARDWQLIRQLPGVDGFVGMSPDRPTPVADEVIALLRGLLAPNGCLYPPNVQLRDWSAPVVLDEPLVRAVPMTVGTNARLLDGPMADMTGLCEWSDSKRVRLLMSLLGHQVRLTVPLDRVEAVSN